MMWALCALLISKRGLPANWVFAITTCFLLLGQIAGALVASATLWVLPLSVETASDLATVMVFVLLASSLVMPTARTCKPAGAWCVPATWRSFLIASSADASWCAIATI
ncbi:MAG: hypothetical protein V8R07_11510 [Bacteroides fragilis]